MHPARAYPHQTEAKKRLPSTHSETVPRKAARTATVTTPVIKEIARYHVTITGKHLGTGSFGTFDLGHYRGMDVVIKTLKVQKVSGESEEDGEKRVRNELGYDARIINKLGDHPGLPLHFGIGSENPPLRLIVQFHGDQMNKTSLTISSALSRKVLISCLH